MKRFRYTLLAVCLVLLWLGWTDISLFLRNRAPAQVSTAALEGQGPPRAWLQVSGGWLDMEQAISTSGTIELDALLVPLKSSPTAEGFGILVETRDPQLLSLFRTYHFQLDTDLEKERFLQEHRAEFHPQRVITGTMITGLIASGNRDKLLKLAREVGMPVAEDVLFISEGKEPPKYRGFFFAGIGLLGLLRLLSLWRNRPAEA
ncbi:MAG: hypothetical protein WDA20_04740 [Desulfuromonadales bacterium]